MTVVALPVFLPLLSAALALLLAGPARRWASLAGQALTFFVSCFLLAETARPEAGALVLAVGDWMPPFGIALAVDLFSALPLAIANFVALVVFFHESRDDQAPFALMHFFVMGANLAFSTGDLFNLFVSFEILLVSSYALFAAGSSRGSARETYPYLLLNVFGSSLFLVAAGFAYAAFGTLNFADLSVRLAQASADPRVGTLAALLLAVFALKAGMVPLHFWLPRSYPRLKPGLAALFSALLTKVGVYSLMRVFGGVLPSTAPFLSTVLVGLGVVTLVLGGLGALSRGSLREILAFHIVSQVGYMLIGIGIGTPLALAGTLCFALHNMLVKSGLFLACDTVLEAHGSDELSRTGGLWRTARPAALVFLGLAFALAGLPPFTGFWAKLTLASAAAEGSAWTELAFLMAGGFLTLASMAKIWIASFWGPEPSTPRMTLRRSSLAAPLALLTATTLLGLGFLDWTGLARSASERLVRHEAYVQDVLRAGSKGRP